MKLNEIKDNEGARHRKMRIGRGIGSGKGKTGGRGQKGQKSRSGVAIKRGFNNPFGKDYAEVNLGMIQKFIDAKKLDAKKAVDQEALNAAGLTRGGKDGVRLLAKGEVTSKLNISVAGASKAAVAAVEKAGGKVEIVSKASAKAAEVNAAKKEAMAKKRAAKTTKK